MTSSDEPTSQSDLARLAQLPELTVLNEEEDLARMHSLVLDFGTMDAELLRGLRKRGYPFAAIENAVQPVATGADGDETPV